MTAGEVEMYANKTTYVLLANNAGAKNAGSRIKAR